MSSSHIDGTTQYAKTANLSQRVNIHDRYGTNPYGWHRWVFDQLLDVGLHGSVLEVGAGTGELWLRNQARLPAGISLTLSDLSSAMVVRLNERCREAPLSATTFVLDVQSLTAPPRFDLIVCNHVLYHVPDRADAIRRLALALRGADGTVVVATNGSRHMVELDELAARHIPAIELGAFGKAFGLETGAAQLREQFEHVDVRRYQDGLLIDDVEAVVAYIASLYDASAEELGALRAEAEELTASGPLAVTKDPGLFVCRGPRVDALAD